MNRKSIVLSFTALILISVALAVYYFVRATPDVPQRAAHPTPSETSSHAADRGQLTRFHSPSIGPRTAPVTIVEFFDPSCEACRAFHPEVKRILADYPDSVQLVLRYVLFHRGSEEVSRILETARRQELFEPVLDAVLAAQPAWHDDPQVIAAWDAAERAGLDVEEARSDMMDSAIDAVLEMDMSDAKAVGIRGTPTFFVNGTQLRRLGPAPLRELVEQKIAEAAE
ncbi:thioredoxin domain-containing protein [Halopseudomonas nanhaiensis]|uniref:DsbA family protein n=1 Tax=Halopseudomonas nanhaiensis TaxID=2830842 RepID=UPI001CBB4788|nr:thioredoxin domain-containing protein [Halopseudomonas nanhaiensis]UAW97235.1 thioredoxin domain-containing protein [Halopseudomonas nanhaiensis]